MSCDVGSDLTFLWLWHRLAATAPILSLAWEPPYATDATLKKKKKKKKKKAHIVKDSTLLHNYQLSSLGLRGPKDHPQVQ